MSSLLVLAPPPLTKRPDGCIFRFKGGTGSTTPGLGKPPLSGGVLTGGELEPPQPTRNIETTVVIKAITVVRNLNITNPIS